jgi:hypothetical protein
MRDNRVVHEIVDQIAERQNVDPMELAPPLYEVVDVDALTAITDTSGVQQPNPDSRLAFQYCGYTVTVNGTGTVTIDDPTGASASAATDPIADSGEASPTGSGHRARCLGQASRIVATYDRPFETQLNGLLEVVRKGLSMEYGTLSYVDSERYVFEAVDSSSGRIEAGEIVPLEQAVNCQRVVETEQSLVVANIGREEPELVDTTWGISSYIGVPVFVDGRIYGTFCFYDTEPRSEAFSDWDLKFVELLSSWVSGQLEKRQQKRALQSAAIDRPVGTS